MSSHVNRSPKHRHALVSCLALIAVCTPALADDLADCTQPNDMPRAVAGCTRLVEAGATPRYRVAIAYRNRSSAYGALGDFERAAQDYAQAVALNPDYLKSAFGTDEDEMQRADVPVSKAVQ